MTKVSKILAGGLLGLFCAGVAHAGDPPMLEVDARGAHRISTTAGGKTWNVEMRAINGLLSILPPLIAIVFALAFRQVFSPRIADA